MRNNQPVTNNERLFNKEERLISVTDLHGTIVHCNDIFITVSGYEKDELIGQPHNLVRHPDMPPEAFKQMWSYLKAGKPWMGLVKNRCKNGDYYWVDAYVTPITENGKIVGYESVRSCPKREDVARAERLYSQFRSGKKPVSLPKCLECIVFFITLCIAAAAYYMEAKPFAYTLLVFNLVAFCCWSMWQKKKLEQQINGLLQDGFSDELAMLSYCDQQGAIGRLMVSIKAERSHLDTVLTRISDASTEVVTGATNSHSQSKQAGQQLKQQQVQTEQVATAMNEMVATISELSGNLQQTSGRTIEANELASEGNHIANNTRTSIAKLGQTVAQIGDSVKGVSEQSVHIASAAQIIEQIAEQTNLLALNAAIEAARAKINPRDPHYYCRAK